MSKTDKKNAKDSKISRFFRGVKSEWGKIIWPDRDTLLKQLAAVLVVTVITGLLIALIDFGAQNLIDFLVELRLPEHTAEEAVQAATEAATEAASIVN